MHYNLNPKLYDPSCRICRERRAARRIFATVVALLALFLAIGYALAHHEADPYAPRLEAEERS